MSELEKTIGFFFVLAVAFVLVVLMWRGVIDLDTWFPDPSPYPAPPKHSSVGPRS